MKLRYVNVGTPLGDFGMLLEQRHETEVVVVSGFAQLEALRAMLPEGGSRIVDTPHDHSYAAMVKRYFDGNMQALNMIPSDQPGGDFFRSVWREMSRIPPGHPFTYAQLAAKAGSPKAVRAAGSACARNRIALLVPCHRVVPSGGKKVGTYLYSSETKRYLLAHEARYANQ